MHGSISLTEVTYRSYYCKPGLIHFSIIIPFTGGEDFGLVDDTVIFEGSTDNIACVSVVIVDDDSFEPRESFQITISNDTNDTRVNMRADMSVSTIFIDDSGR